MAETTPLDLSLSVESSYDGDPEADRTHPAVVRLDGPGLTVTVEIDPDNDLAMAILPPLLKQLPQAIVHSLSALLDDPVDGNPTPEEDCRG